MTDGNTTAAKKASPAAKKAPTAKKASPAAKKATTVKKASPAAKKATTVKKASPAAKKATTVKKASPAAKKATTVKKASPAAKKATTVKKASPAAKKATTVKKASPAAKKATTAKKPSPAAKKATTVKRAQASARKAKSALGSKYVKRAQTKARKILNDPEKLQKIADESNRSAAARSGPFADVMDDFRVLVRLVVAYSRGHYREIRPDALVLVVTGLIYVVSPVDLIPDVIPVAGFMDDAVVIGFVIKSVRGELDAFREWELGAASVG